MDGGFQKVKVTANKGEVVMIETVPPMPAWFVEACGRIFRLDKGQRFALLVGDISEPAQGAPIDRR